MYQVIIMRTRYIFVLLFALVIMMTVLVTNQQKHIVEVKQVFEPADKKADSNMKNIHEETEKYVIDGFIPVTNYEVLNKALQEKINAKVIAFKQETEALSVPEGDIKYTLGIVYDSYAYQDMLSFVVRISKDIGGAHPFTSIFTVTYDTKKNKLVTLDDLVNKNENLLKILSDQTRKLLSDNDKIKENPNDEMFAKGTEPKKENFQNFAFSREGLVIFFEAYAIAPYSSGSFEVTIPYDTLGLT